MSFAEQKPNDFHPSTAYFCKQSRASRLLYMSRNANIKQLQLDKVFIRLD